MSIIYCDITNIIDNNSNISCNNTFIIYQDIYDVIEVVDNTSNIFYNDTSNITIIVDNTSNISYNTSNKINEPNNDFIWFCLDDKISKSEKITDTSVSYLSKPLKIIYDKIMPSTKISDNKIHTTPIHYSAPNISYNNFDENDEYHHHQHRQHHHSHHENLHKPLHYPKNNK